MQFTDEQFKKDSEQLIDFIYKSPSPYHVVNNIAAVLNENGFIRLSEGKAWKINPSGRYYRPKNLACAPMTAVWSSMSIASQTKASMSS